MAKTCNNCGTNEEMAVMPIAQHEKDQNRLMLIIKWLVGVIVALIVLLVGSNIAWIVYESQFETVETWEQEVIQDAENGENNFVGGDYYGEADY
ncbi:MAG: hypothetical protein U0M06_02190 [Clostridia bacterium]|nr:hypothetical protein [Clostridia bacterium]